MTLRWDDDNTIRTDRRAPLPFNVIDRAHLEPVVIPEPSRGETAAFVGLCIAAIIMTCLALIGAVVASRWAWNHPGQFGVGLGLTCFAGWGLWEVIKS